MAYDLIRRAGERLAQQQAAPPAAETPQVDDQPRIAEAPAPVAEPPEAPVADDPVVPLRQPIIRPQPVAAPEQPHGRRRTSREISVDLPRLRLAGMVTPDGDMDRPIVEEFRLIKRPLLVKAFGPERKTRNTHLVMVASAHAGEGKSYIAHNLALSIASEADTHVLLVDADLYSPSAPQRFGFAAEHGLIDVLADDGTDLADVLLRTDVGNLTILPAGKRHARATELLASPRMARVMAEMAQRYPDRVIIFDAPPVLASSEPSVLAMHVGQILMVVEADKTSRNAIEDSLALLGGCPDVSFVLNKRRKWMALEKLGA